MKNLLGLLCLLSLGCAPESSSIKGWYENFDESKLNEFKDKVKAIPEYALQTTGVIFSGTKPDQSDVGQLISTEVTGIYRAILQTNPGLEYYLYASDQVRDGVSSDQSFWQQNLSSFTDKINFRSVNTSIDPAFNDYVYMHTWWSRDSSPISGFVEGSTKNLLIDLNYWKDRPQDDGIPSDLAEVSGVERISLPLFLDGGDFMITAEGICATTSDIFEDNGPDGFPRTYGTASLTEGQVHDYLKHYLGCKKLVIVDPLPFEATKHIDLFAKFVSDSKVLINDYSENNFNVGEVVKKRYYKCTAAQIQSGNWWDCEMSASPPGMPESTIGNLFVPKKNNDGSPEILSKNQLVDLLNSTGAEFDIINSIPNYPAAMASVARIFEQEGFEVVKIETPPPLAGINIDFYLDEFDQVVRKAGFIKFIHRSFANSQLINGKAYVPQYPLLTTEDLNLNAQKTYRDLGFEVIGLNSDGLIHEEGSIHCITMQITSNRTATQ